MYIFEELQKWMAPFQVDYVIKEARDLDNLCMLYEGWTPWVWRSWLARRPPRWWTPHACMPVCLLHSMHQSSTRLPTSCPSMQGWFLVWLEGISLWKQLKNFSPTCHWAFCRQQSRSSVPICNCGENWYSYSYVPFLWVSAACRDLTHSR